MLGRGDEHPRVPENSILRINQNVWPTVRYKSVHSTAPTNFEKQQDRWSAPRDLKSNSSARGGLCFQAQNAAHSTDAILPVGGSGRRQKKRPPITDLKSAPSAFAACFSDDAGVLGRLPAASPRRTNELPGPRSTLFVFPTVLPSACLSTRKRHDLGSGRRLSSSVFVKPALSCPYKAGCRQALGVP